MEQYVITSPFKDNILAGKVSPRLILSMLFLNFPQTLLISGGATGIGFGICKVFASHGAKIAMMGRREEVLKAAVEKLTVAGLKKTKIEDSNKDALNDNKKCWKKR